MMALLFVIFFVSLYLILMGQRKKAIILTVLNLFFCTLMLIYHATSTLYIRL